MNVIGLSFASNAVYTNLLLENIEKIYPTYHILLLDDSYIWSFTKITDIWLFNGHNWKLISHFTLES